MSNLIKRIITGLILALIFVGALYVSRYTTLILLLICSNIAIYELQNALIKMNYKSDINMAYAFNTIFLIISFFLNNDVVFPIYTLYIVLLFVILVLDENRTFNLTLSNSFIATYVTFPYAYLVMLKESKWIFYAFAINAFTDTFAYIFGMTIGKHKLLERVSPKKTVEGSIGGIIGALLFNFIFITFFKLEHRFISYFAAVIISIIAQIGDLFASYLKRKSGIKDFGTILVGHGGIMDRFDSLLLVAPLVYILVYNLR